MLEKEAGLHTWRLQRSPDQPGLIAATPLAEHRKAYLDYEGPVSGDRGSVIGWDRGQYGTVAETIDRIEVQVAGERLAGRVVLTRTSESAWLFEFTPTINSADPSGS